MKQKNIILFLFVSFLLFLAIVPGYCSGGGNRADGNVWPGTRTQICHRKRLVVTSFRLKIDLILWPDIFIATLSGTPARTMVRPAVLLRSWNILSCLVKAKLPHFGQARLLMLNITLSRCFHLRCLLEPLWQPYLYEWLIRHVPFVCLDPDRFQERERQPQRNRLSGRFQIRKSGAYHPWRIKILGRVMSRPKAVLLCLWLKLRDCF